jgi:predicted permease
VRTLDLGINPDRVLVVSTARDGLARFEAGSDREAERSRRRAFLRTHLDAVRRVPGITHAAVAVGMPFGNRFSVRVRVAGRDVPRLPTGRPSLSAVTPDYFTAIGTPILRGRAFTEADRPDGERVAIVSDTMARTVWPGEDALGQCLLIGDGAPPCTRVVGVAGNARRSRLREEPVLHFYIPAGQESGFGGDVLLVRTSGDPWSVSRPLQVLLAGLDSTITYATADTLRDWIAPQERPWLIGASVFTLSGGLALVVAGIGLFSVMSYLIADRRREIGVRLALGARPREVVALVVRGSVGMAAAGVLVGLSAAAALGSFAEPLLFQTSPREPMVFVGVSVVLVGVSLLAAAGPARRALRIDACDVLRGE